MSLYDIFVTKSQREMQFTQYFTKIIYSVPNNALYEDSESFSFCILVAYSEPFIFYNLSYVLIFDWLDSKWFHMAEKLRKFKKTAGV
jgi:hypothetical protein